MGTVALEFVPPDLDSGAEGAREEAEKVKRLLGETGLTGRIDSVMIPGMIAEESDRPLELKPKMDPLDTWNAVREVLPVRGICTQVTAFSSEQELAERFATLRAARLDRVIMVGVPRTMADGEGDGVAPTDALDLFREQLPGRGVILIPTREGEHGRFKFKCDQGANLALTQLLFSDYVVEYLREHAKHSAHRPEILLSFGYVPKAEERVGLINWLIRDENPLVEREMDWVRELAPKPFAEKKQLLVDHYKRVIDGVRDLGFPIGIHLEAVYGFSKPAFETFAEMLDYYTP